MRYGKISSLLPKLNVFESSYIDSKTCFNENEDEYLTVREPSGSCKFKCKSVSLNFKRVFDVEKLYFDLFKKCMEYNLNFKKRLDLKSLLESEEEFGNESIDISSKFYERCKLKLILHCCRIFFEQIQSELKLDFPTFFVILKDPMSYEKLPKNGLLEKLLNIMIDGDTIYSYFGNSLVCLKCYENVLTKRLFKKNSAFIELYLSLVLDLSLDVHAIFSKIIECRFLGDSVFACMVWGFLLDIPVFVDENKSRKVYNISKYANFLYKGRFTSYFETPGPAWGHSELNEMDSLKKVEDLMSKFFKLAQVFNCEDLLFNATLITQIRSLTVGLNFDNGSFYRLVLYLVYLKKFFDFVILKLKSYFSKAHIDKLFLFRAGDRFRNYDLKEKLYSLKCFDRVADEWKAESENSLEVHTWLAPFINEERNVWSAAILPFYVEIMFLCLSEKHLLQKVESKPRHVGGK